MEGATCRGQFRTFMIAFMILIGNAAIAEANDPSSGHQKHGHHDKHLKHHGRKHHHHSGSHPGDSHPVQDTGSGVSLGDSDLLLGGLSESYYAATCPSLSETVSNTVQQLIRNDNTLPAAWLRMLFHDCFVQGCDASVLINLPGAERDAVPNAGSLRGFDEMESVKTAVEQVCPGVVSCADILALAARDAVYQLSGAFWQVPFGRRDGLVSNEGDANNALPSPFFTYDELVSNFQAVGLNEKDMVVLSGAHTIGFAHCTVVTPRLYNFAGSVDGVDPSLNKKYATRLQQECPQGAASSGVVVPLDPTGGNQTFDSQYYANVLRNKGVLSSDAALLTDSRGQDIVQRESGNIFNPNTRFFFSFGKSMERMSRLNVKTGTDGEVRTKCTAFNSQTAS